MNIKRIIFWLVFIVIISLIIWGLIVASYREPGSSLARGVPADITSTDNVRGPENASITLIEYADYQCPACASYYPVVERLISDASTTLRFVARHFPLPQHRNAIIAAQAAEAAGKQGKYWDMAGLLYDNQKSWETLADAQAKSIFKGYAERLKLDISKYEADFIDESIKNKIEGDRADGLKVGIKGTPTFFLNGKAIANPTSYAEFKKIIEDAITSVTK